MNKTTSIFLTILAFAISIICCIFESASYVYYDAQNVYRVYLNGESIGIIESEKQLEDYINEKQEALKQKYNVENVYIPNGLKIKKETTYNEQTESIENIYNKISAQEDFTIDGYIVKITEFEKEDKNKEENKDKEDKKENKKEKIKREEYLYVLNKSIIQDAVNDVVKSFVNEKDYQDYLNEVTKDTTKKGTIIENVYIKEQITIRPGKISANETIYQTEQELAKYLLFGTNEKNKTYKVKSGDTVETIAYDNEMSTTEFLIANKDITDETALLYKGQEVIISYIDPVITIVEETHTVKEEDVRFDTIERKDETKYIGYSKVVQQGKKGKSLVTRKIQKENGKITYAIITGNEKIKEPVDKIVVVGKNTGYAAGTSTNWAWPTVKNYTITEYFGYGLRSEIGETVSRLHAGIDVAGLGCGSPIYAINSGTVTHSGWYYGLGIAVIINHNNGYQSLYGHLNGTFVKQGQAVQKGQPIGSMGNTGYSFGCHLHLEVKYGGNYLDPMKLF